jgi:hypothetical protein
MQVGGEDLVQAQILGEIEAVQAIEPVMGRGKRVKASKEVYEFLYLISYMSLALALALVKLGFLLH